jgi:hypothetical protein
MQSAEWNSVRIPKFVASDLNLRVGKESLMLKLALVWNTEIARRYPKIIKEGELSATLSPADWCGLAVIECAFSKFSRKNSIDPIEHELGVARFLKFLVNQWYEIEFGKEQSRPPNLYFAACHLGVYLIAWDVADDDTDRMPYATLQETEEADEADSQYEHEGIGDDED